MAKKQKTPFKESKFGKIILSAPVKSIASGILDVLPIPNVISWFDKDSNGKVNWEDVKQFKGVDYLKIAAAVGTLGALIKLNIVDLEVVVQLLHTFMGQ